MDPAATPSSTQDLLSQGHAYGWNASLLWLNVFADIAIAIVAVVVPLLLLKACQRRPDLALQRVAHWLVAFGLLSAAALIADLWNLWHADYRIEAALQLLAAIAGTIAMVLALKTLPTVLAMPTASQLKDAREAAIQAQRELEAFTASVSHDLRSPLSSIAGQAGMLEISMGERVNDDQKRRLHRIQSSVKQMSELIEALLMISRISRMDLRLESIDLTSVAQEVCADLQRLDPQRAVHIQIQPNMHLTADRRLIGSLLENLLNNAWRFTSRTESSSIEVGVAQSQNEITLHVRDNGLGFDRSATDKLFKPFQKLHGNDLSRAGMGLAIVRRIVERHGGRTWAEGRADEGAVFYCAFPLSTSAPSTNRES
jgi:light-regulated signal transduction histidine kinase (bacteriophytochrome)